MDNVKLIIREKYNKMSKSEKLISDFIMKDTLNILKMTALDIAKASGVSSASVIRYVKKLGFDGLDSFKIEISAHREQDKQNKWKMVDPILCEQDNIDSICLKMQNRTETAFLDFFHQLDKKALKQAGKCVKNSRKIYIIGLGSSYCSAYDLFHKLRRAGFDANCYQDINMVVEFLNYVDEKDTLLTFSYSGESFEILYATEKAKEKKAKVIAITRNNESRLKNLADICLFVPDNENVQRIGAFESFQTSLMMAWLLYLIVIKDNFEQIEIELIKTRKMVEGLK